MSLKKKNKIKEAVKLRDYMPDTVMIQEGKYNNAAYIIVEGVARMETQVKSKQSPKDETDQ